MSEENVEAVRRLLDAFPSVQDSLRRGEFPMGAFFAEDIEWDASEMGLPDLGDGRLHGHEGVRRFWMAWLAPWENVRFEYELRDAGDHVVALIDQSMSAREGMNLGTGRYAQSFTFRAQQCVRWKVFMDETEALRAAGLLE